MIDHNMLLISSPSHFSQIWSSYISDLGSCLHTDLVLIVFDPTSQSFITVRVHQTALLHLSPLLSGLVQDNATSHPSIICEDITLPILQCLLTLVYTGSCVLTRDCTLYDLLIMMKNLGIDIFSNLEQAIVSAEDNSASPMQSDHHIINPNQEAEYLDQEDCSQSTTRILQTEISGIRKLSSPKSVLNSSRNKFLEPFPTRSPADQDYQFKCNDCGEILPSPVHLIYHMHLKHPEGGRPGDPTRLHCKFCQHSVRMERKDSLIPHLENRHSEYECSMCDETFKHRQNNLAPFKRFVSHNSEKHQDKARFSFNLCLESQSDHCCTLCSSSFSSLARLYYHMATQHAGEGAEGYKCRFCSFSISYKNHSLLEHLMIHTGEKSNVCRFCGKKFTAKKTLFNHEQLHTGEKHIECSKCDARFVQKSSLLCHIKKHHRETGNKENVRSALGCGFCGKKFKYGGSLKNHMKLHIVKNDLHVKLSDIGDADNSVKQECVLKEMKGSMENKLNVFTCSTCPVQLHSKVAREGHERKHSQPTVWAQCGSCSGFYLISRGSCRRCPKKV